MAIQSSPFSGILHTNAVPSDAHCKRIHDLLQGPHREISDLDEEIDRTHSLLEELIRKRETLADFISAHLAVVSPARRLPEDIVRNIFMECIPLERNPLIIQQDPPILLCQICSAWRNLALSTPRLWTAVHVVIPNQPKVQVLTEMLSLWLGRSGVLPLSISVVFSRTWGGDTDAPLPLLTRLMEFARRWKHIVFTFPHHKNFAVLETLSSDDVPVLESITVQGIERRVRWAAPDNGDYPPDSFKFLSFLDNPTLRRVSISYHRELRRFPLPWGRLSSLSFENGSFSCNEAVALLRDCPALETCRLVLGYPFEPAVFSESPISLPHLQDLWVCAQTHDHLDIVSFFKALNLPNLHTLEYSHFCSTIGDLFPFFPLFPSTGSLQRFSLIMMELPDGAQVSECLSAMPLLREWKLEIQSRPHRRFQQKPHEYVVTHLTPSLHEPDSTPCPLLESLSLRGLNDTVSDQALMNLVQERTAPGLRGITQLSHVACVIERAMQIDILPLLEDRISAGLAISIDYLPPYIPKYSAAEGTDQEPSPFIHW
ncbi:hypothetical protein C8R43DRAFT_402159 [Mycena crocata]|nr:hypothetical protein C8R43DRAFT_402159 [Mycena crocata]